MKLEVTNINGNGKLEEEVVWLKVLEDCNIKYYMLTDTTYTDDDHISNELRHIYWFKSKNVTKGDFIALYTKNGENQSFKNRSATMTHEFYWNLGRTVWNKDGDCAVLFELNAWKTTAA